MLQKYVSRQISLSQKVTVTCDGVDINRNVIMILILILRRIESWSGDELVHDSRYDVILFDGSGIR